MALVKCPECHADVSTKARACTGCGYPIADDGAAPPGIAAAPSPEQGYGPAAPVCSRCGRNSATAYVKAHRPFLLVMAFIFLAAGGFIMGLSDSESHKTITALAATGLAAWSVISFFRKQDAVDCRLCGHKEFTVPWSDL